MIFFRDLFKIIPDSVCMEVVIPGFGSSIPFWDLPEVDRCVLMNTVVERVEPCDFEWLKITVGALVVL